MKNSALISLYVLAVLGLVIGGSLIVAAVVRSNSYDVFSHAANMATLLDMNLSDIDISSLQASQAAREAQDVYLGAAIASAGFLALLFALASSAIGFSVKQGQQLQK